MSTLITLLVVVDEPRGHVVEVAELGVAVGVLAALGHLGVGLQRGAQPVQQGAYRAGGLDASGPLDRADARALRAHPELFAEAAPRCTTPTDPLARPGRPSPMWPTRTSG